MQTNPPLFPSYKLTATELAQALNLPDLTKALLQTMLSGFVEERLAMRLTPANFNEFIQQESYIVGRIDLLTELLHPLPPVEVTAD